MRALWQLRRLAGGFRRTYAATAEQSAAASDELHLTFASPNKVIINNQVVRQVDVSTLSGSLGILPKHVPVLGMLKPGIVHIVDNDGQSIKYFASSGTLSVNPDGSCQVLAEEAVKLDEIDQAKAEEALREAQRRINEPIEEAERAKIQIEIETYEALIRAVQESDKR